MSQMRYKLNNTGSETTINESIARWHAFSGAGGQAQAYDVCTGRIQYCVNLTENWYINLRVNLDSTRSVVEHTLRGETPAKVRIQYLGTTATDVNI